MNTRSKEVYSVPPNQIKFYLKINDWSLRNENERWLVFSGGHSVDIILAKDVLAPDYHVYVDHMLRTLSSATGKAPETIANDILCFDHDVLTLAVDSDSVDNFAKQVPGIKVLVGHSANSEHNLKPYFTQYYKAARNMLEHFQIRQKLNGKPCYLVESRVGEKQPYQRVLIRDELDPGFKLPLQRRVMERIASGLIMAEKAATANDAQVLIDGYVDGFNANMCDAVWKMSKQSPLSIQYSFKWSRRVSASKGLEIVKNLQIERRHNEYLKRASDKLKAVEPEFESIRGRVVGLSSLDDPQSDELEDVERSIIVFWDHGRGRPRKLRINLGKR